MAAVCLSPSLRRLSQFSRLCYSTSSAQTLGTSNINPRKLVIGEHLRDVFSSSQFVAVLHYNDLKTSDWNEVRYKLDQHSIMLKVIPTKITIKALQDTKYSNICTLMNGPTSLAYSDKPCINDLLTVLKHEPKLYLLGGLVDNELLTEESIKNYAKLPNKDNALIQLTSNLLGHQRNLVRLLEHGTRELNHKLNHLANN